MSPKHRLFAAASVAALFTAPASLWAAEAELTILHMNDVYEISPEDGHGGFAPMMTLLKKERANAENTVTTLGGDFLSPSVMSGLTKGAQMVDLFNAVGVDVAVFGNHEFDFGPEVAQERIGESKFPWLGANVLLNGQVFGGAKATHIVQVGDVKFGFFGVLTPETEQLSSTGAVDVTEVEEASRKAIEELKAQGAHVIVALTHLTLAEDRELMQAVPEIDVILGGHDHDPIQIYDDSGLIFKVGADNEFLGALDLRVNVEQTDKGEEVTVLPAEWRLTSTAGVEPDPQIAELVAKYEAQLDESLGVEIGQSSVELDTRKDTVRTTESNFANLIADAMRENLGADVALTNGGGIRGDKQYPAGTVLTRKDVLTELPFGNVAVLMEVKGSTLREALENGVSQVEGKAGRFPHVSGMTVKYDPSKPAGQRVVEVMVGGKPLDPDATYKLATSDYMAGGGDGYAALTSGKVLVDASGAKLMASHVMDYVEAKKTVAPQIEGRVVAVQ